jgi:hypothetical protein
MQGWILKVGLIVGLATSSVACSSPTPAELVSDGERSSVSVPADRPVNEDGGGGGRMKAEAEAETETGSDLVARGPKGASERKPDGSSAVTEMPFESKVDLNSKVFPACVTAGQTVRITVRTEAEAPVAYHAIYAGEQGGAEPPFGGGHGGNDQGMTSEEGLFESSWVVGVTAPSGPARVDVVVGYDGKFGYDAPRFAVANKQGKCPSRWLEPDGEG